MSVNCHRTGAEYTGRAASRYLWYPDGGFRHFTFVLGVTRPALLERYRLGGFRGEEPAARSDATGAQVIWPAILECVAILHLWQGLLWR